MVDTAVAGRTATHCPYCALQCGMLLDVGERQAKARVTVEADPDFPTNRGALCEKGWTAAELLASPERLTVPLARAERGLPLRPVSWEVALSRVADGIAAVQTAYGVDAVGVFGGGGLTNEKAYQLGKFTRVALGSANIDYNGRFCMSVAAAAANAAFGLDRGLPFPLADIAATDAILLVGSNLADTMPPAMRYLREQREHGGALIVVDPRATPTPTAAAATLHLQPLPGTDLALALGLLHIAHADRRLDHDFIDARTTGFDELAAVLPAYWPERVEQLTGVPAPLLHRAVELFATAPTGMVLTARGAEQHATGVDTTLAFINLALALGKAGRPCCGYGAVTGQGNGQGGREHGQKADQLPGYRKIADPAACAHVAAVWGVPPETLPGPGRSAYELLDSLGQPDGVRALLVFGSNPVVSAPHAGHVERRLGALDLLVVADVVLSETAALADVVLPSAQWAEETGTMTNLEGRVILRRRALEPPPQVRTDLAIISAIAQRLGCGTPFDAEPEAVFTELRRARAGGLADYAGISYPRIDAEQGVFWPCPDEDHPGTPRLFLNVFAHSDGRARFHPVEHRAATEPVDEAFPLYLTTGRVRAQYQSGAQTRRIGALAAAAPGPFVELHPHLAERLGVGDGDALRVTSRRGSATAPARTSAGIRADTVFMPSRAGSSTRLYGGCSSAPTRVTASRPRRSPLAPGCPASSCCARRRGTPNAGSGCCSGSASRASTAPPGRCGPPTAPRCATTRSC